MYCRQIVPLGIRPAKTGQKLQRTPYFKHASLFFKRWLPILTELPWYENHLSQRFCRCHMYENRLNQRFCRCHQWFYRFHHNFTTDYHGCCVLCEFWKLLRLHVIIWLHAILINKQIYIGLETTTSIYCPTTLFWFITHLVGLTQD